MSLSRYNVTTTNGEVFTGEQSAKLAFLVYVRFGRNLGSAHSAWKRMLQNNCSLMHFSELVDAGATWQMVSAKASA